MLYIFQTTTTLLAALYAGAKTNFLWNSWTGFFKLLKVPDDWRPANVSLVFKKGEKYDAANYRPVSLTYIYCKILEHILVSNTNKHLALDSILADCQHGFGSQRSCETQLVQFVHDIISNLDGAMNLGHKQTDLINMDFAKAFNKVPHRRLLHTLEYNEIRGTTH